jgi:S-formylglutathione hydrolase
MTLDRRELAAGVLSGALLASSTASAAEQPSLRAGFVTRVPVQTTLVPGPVNVSIYTPSTADRGARLPLMVLLHGGNGSDLDLLRLLPGIDGAIRDGRIPPMVIAMPSAGRSLYMDFKDGSQRWESFILGELLAYLRRTFPVGSDRRHTFIGGISMGGLGSLRLAFKHPAAFGAVAAVEPAVEPALAWRDVGPRVKFWRPEAVLAPMFGTPVDEAYWAANNPSSIARSDPTRLYDLPVYIEVGDQDMLYLAEGVEFLHRILFEAGVGHEYRLVRGADHVGPSIMPRVVDALAFIGREIRPVPWIDGSVVRARAAFEQEKRSAGVATEVFDSRRIHGRY